MSGSREEDKITKLRAAVYQRILTDNIVGIDLQENATTKWHDDKLKQRQSFPREGSSVVSHFEKPIVDKTESIGGGPLDEKILSIANVFRLLYQKRRYDVEDTPLWWLWNHGDVTMRLALERMHRWIYSTRPMDVILLMRYAMTSFYMLADEGAGMPDTDFVFEYEYGKTSGIIAFTIEQEEKAERSRDFDKKMDEEEKQRIIQQIAYAEEKDFSIAMNELLITNLEGSEGILPIDIPSEEGTEEPFQLEVTWRRREESVKSMTAEELEEEIRELKKDMDYNEKKNDDNTETVENEVRYQILIAESEIRKKDDIGKYSLELFVKQKDYEETDEDKEVTTKTSYKPVTTYETIEKKIKEQEILIEDLPLKTGMKVYLGESEGKIIKTKKERNKKLLTVELGDNIFQYLGDKENGFRKYDGSLTNKTKNELLLTLKKELSEKGVTLLDILTEEEKKDIMKKEFRKKSVAELKGMLGEAEANLKSYKEWLEFRKEEKEKNLAELETKEKTVAQLKEFAREAKIKLTVTRKKDIIEQILQELRNGIVILEKEQKEAENELKQSGRKDYLLDKLLEEKKFKIENYKEKIEKSLTKELIRYKINKLLQGDTRVRIVPVEEKNKTDERNKRKEELSTLVKDEDLVNKALNGELSKEGIEEKIKFLKRINDFEEIEDNPFKDFVYLKIERKFASDRPRKAGLLKWSCQKNYRVTKQVTNAFLQWLRLGRRLRLESTAKQHYMEVAYYDFFSDLRKFTTAKGRKEAEQTKKDIAEGQKNSAVANNDAALAQSIERRTRQLQLTAAGNDIKEKAGKNILTEHLKNILKEAINAITPESIKNVSDETEGSGDVEKATSERVKAFKTRLQTKLNDTIEAWDKMFEERNVQNFDLARLPNAFQNKLKERIENKLKQKIESILGKRRRQLYEAQRHAEEALRKVEAEKEKLKAEEERQRKEEERQLKAEQDRQQKEEERQRKEEEEKAKKRKKIAYDAAAAAARRMAKKRKLKEDRRRKAEEDAAAEAKKRKLEEDERKENEERKSMEIEDGQAQRIREDAAKAARSQEVLQTFYEEYKKASEEKEEFLSREKLFPFAVCENEPKNKEDRIIQEEPKKQKQSDPSEVWSNVFSDTGFLENFAVNETIIKRDYSDQTSKQNYISLQPEDFNNNPKSLQEVIDEKCKTGTEEGEKNCYEIVGNYFCIYFQYSQYDRKSNVSSIVSLKYKNKLFAQDDIEINLTKKTFRLSGVLSYRNDSAYATKGHYVAYLRKLNGWWRANDKTVEKVTGDIENWRQTDLFKPTMLFFRNQEVSFDQRIPVGIANPSYYCFLIALLQNIVNFPELFGDVAEEVSSDPVNDGQPPNEDSSAETPLQEEDSDEQPPEPVSASGTPPPQEEVSDGQPPEPAKPAEQELTEAGVQSASPAEGEGEDFLYENDKLEIDFLADQLGCERGYSSDAIGAMLKEAKKRLDEIEKALEAKGRKLVGDKNQNGKVTVTDTELESEQEKFKAYKDRLKNFTKAELESEQEKFEAYLNRLRTFKTKVEESDKDIKDGFLNQFKVLEEMQNVRQWVRKKLEQTQTLNVLRDIYGKQNVEEEKLKIKKSIEKSKTKMKISVSESTSVVPKQTLLKQMDNIIETSQYGNINDFSEYKEEIKKWMKSWNEKSKDFFEEENNDLRVDVNNLENEFSNNDEWFLFFEKQSNELVGAFNVENFGTRQPELGLLLTKIDKKIKNLGTYMMLKLFQHTKMKNRVVLRLESSRYAIGFYLGLILKYDLPLLITNIDRNWEYIRPRKQTEFYTPPPAEKNEWKIVFDFLKKYFTLKKENLEGLLDMDERVKVQSENDDFIAKQKKQFELIVKKKKALLDNKETTEGEREDFFKNVKTYRDEWINKFDVLSTVNEWLLLQSPEKIVTTIMKIRTVRTTIFYNDNWFQKGMTERKKKNNGNFQRITNLNKEKIKVGDFLFYPQYKEGNEPPKDYLCLVVFVGKNKDNVDSVFFYSREVKAQNSGQKKDDETVADKEEDTIESLIRQNVQWFEGDAAFKKEYERKQKALEKFDEVAKLTWYDEGCRDELKNNLKDLKKLTSDESKKGEYQDEIDDLSNKKSIQESVEEQVNKIVEYLKEEEEINKIELKDRLKILYDYYKSDKSLEDRFFYFEELSNYFTQELREKDFFDNEFDKYSQKEGKGDNAILRIRELDEFKNSLNAVTGETEDDDYTAENEEEDVDEEEEKFEVLKRCLETGNEAEKKQALTEYVKLTVSEEGVNDYVNFFFERKKTANEIQSYLESDDPKQQESFYIELQIFKIQKKLNTQKNKRDQDKLKPMLKKWKAYEKWFLSEDNDEKKSLLEDYKKLFDIGKLKNDLGDDSFERNPEAVQNELDMNQEGITKVDQDNLADDKEESAISRFAQQVSDFIENKIENVQQYKDEGDRKKAANEVYEKFLEDKHYKKDLQDAEGFVNSLSNNKKISKKDDPLYEEVKEFFEENKNSEKSENLFEKYKKKKEKEAKDAIKKHIFESGIDWENLASVSTDIVQIVDVLSDLGLQEAVSNLYLVRKELLQKQRRKNEEKTPIKELLSSSKFFKELWEESWKDFLVSLNIGLFKAPYNGEDDESDEKTGQKSQKKGTESSEDVINAAEEAKKDQNSTVNEDFVKILKKIKKEKENKKRKELYRKAFLKYHTDKNLKGDTEEEIRLVNRLKDSLDVEDAEGLDLKKLKNVEMLYQKNKLSEFLGQVEDLRKKTIAVSMFNFVTELNKLESEIPTETYEERKNSHLKNLMEQKCNEFPRDILMQFKKEEEQRKRKEKKKLTKQKETELERKVREIIETVCSDKKRLELEKKATGNLIFNNIFVKDIDEGKNKGLQSRLNDLMLKEYKLDKEFKITNARYIKKEWTKNNGITVVNNIMRNFRTLLKKINIRERRLYDKDADNFQGDELLENRERYYRLANKNISIYYENPYEQILGVQFQVEDDKQDNNLKEKQDNQIPTSDADSSSSSESEYETDEEDKAFIADENEVNTDPVSLDDLLKDYEDAKDEDKPDIAKQIEEKIKLEYTENEINKAKRPEDILDYVALLKFLSAHLSEGFDSEEDDEDVNDDDSQITDFVAGREKNYEYVVEMDEEEKEAASIYKAEDCVGKEAPDGKKWFLFKEKANEAEDGVAEGKATDEGSDLLETLRKIFDEDGEKAVKAYANDRKNKVTVPKLKLVVKALGVTGYSSWNKKKLTEEIIKKLEENSKQ